MCFGNNTSVFQKKVPLFIAYYLADNFSENIDVGIIVSISKLELVIFELGI